MKLESNKFITALQTLFGFVGVVMILIETYVVVARNILSIPTPWSDELMKLLFIWAIFVGSGLAFLSDDLISLTLLEDSAKDKGKMKIYGFFKIFQYVVAIIISCLLVYQLTTIMGTQMSTGEATTTLKYPLWVMNLGVFLGMAMILVFGVIKLIDCKKYFKE